MSQASQKPFERVWVLPWLAAGAALAIGFGLVPQLRQQIAFVPPSPFENDAPEGTAVELPARDLHGQPIDPTCRTLLVYAGACSSCPNSAVSPERLRNTPFPQVVLLYFASDRQLVELYPRVRENVKLVAAAEGKIIERLGATSPPRFYVLENGRLTKIWQSASELPEEWMGALR